MSEQQSGVKAVQGQANPQQNEVLQRTKEDPEYVESMCPVYTSQNNLDKELDDISSLYRKVVERKQLELNVHYKGSSEKAEKELRKLEAKLKRIEEQMRNDPVIFQLQDEIQGFKQQKSTLERAYQQQQNEKLELYERIQKTRQEVKQQKLSLKQCNRENLRLTYILEEVQRRASQPPPEAKSMVSHTLEQSTTVQHGSQQPSIESSLEVELNEIKREVQRAKVQNQKVRRAQAKFVSKNRAIEEFFTACWQTAEKELLKAQRMVTDKQGLSGSLYFELMNKHAAEHKAQPQVKKGPKAPKDLIYETFKKMALIAREEFKNRELVQLEVSWEEFNKFSPLQLLGLLSLRPDVVIQLHQHMFPNNLLNKQSMPMTMMQEPYSLGRQKEELHTYLRKKEEQIFARMQQQFKAL